MPGDIVEITSWIAKLKKLFGCSEPVAGASALKAQSNRTTFPPTCYLRPAPHPSNTGNLASYLENQGNRPDSIARFNTILKMSTVILELGCGNSEISWQIAMKNPDIGIVATDLYRSPCLTDSDSGYARANRSWVNGLLKAQVLAPDNLAVLRADADIIRFLPVKSIDTVLLINPEPAMGRAFLKFLEEDLVASAIRPGSRQLVIKPFSKKMGVTTCGGYEFDTEADWSRGIGFMMESPFNFKESAETQWEVDLGAFSDYSKNSTQTGVSICGNIAIHAPMG